MIGLRVYAAIDNRHFDHAKSLDAFIKLGIPCYGNEDVCNAYEGCELIPKLLHVGGFKIQTFDVPHNVQNNAFVIDTTDKIRILYVTDAKDVPYIVKNVDYAIVECNYSEEDVDEFINGIEIKSRYYNHLSLEKCISYLKRIFNKNMKGIILWHPSLSNLNVNNAKKRVIEELGFNDVFVARKGMTINIVKEEF